MASLALLPQLGHPIRLESACPEKHPATSFRHPPSTSSGSFEENAEIRAERRWRNQKDQSRLAETCQSLIHRDQENFVREVSEIALLVNHRLSRDPAEHPGTAFSDPLVPSEKVDCSVYFPVVHSSENCLATYLSENHHFVTELLTHHSAAEQANAIRCPRVLAALRPSRTAPASASSAVAPQDFPSLCEADRAAQNLNPAARTLAAICWRDSSGLPETAAVVEAERKISQEPLRAFSAAMKGHQPVTAIRAIAAVSLIPSGLARNSSAEIPQATANVLAVPCVEADRPHRVPVTAVVAGKDRPERLRN